MKKLLPLALMLVLVISLVSCSLLPEELRATIDGVKNDILGALGEDGEHVHDFVHFTTIAPKCSIAGSEVEKCVCGKTRETEIPALGHDMQIFSEAVVNCDQYGTITYKCTRCTNEELVTTKPTEHVWGELVEASRLLQCTKEGCTGTKLVEADNKFGDALTFTFGDEEKQALDAKYDEIYGLLQSADKYSKDDHGYAEEGELMDSYEAVYKVYEEYTDLIYGAMDQYTVAMTLYYVDIDNDELEKTYNNMMNYYTGLVSTYYSLSRPWYNSMYRNYFFYGATEADIQAFLFDSDAYSDPVYAEIKERNDAIELEFYNIQDPKTSNKVAALYEEFAANNNRLAKLLGYETYLDYAYENVYDRDYTYQDVSEFVEYVKEYIVPVYNMLYGKWNSASDSGLTVEDVNDYYDIVYNSFFESLKGNTVFNDYIDLMDMGFSSNSDKVISFSDELNKLVLDGNLFRGSYKSAYVTYLLDNDIPIAYFGGEGYDSSFTVAHEFGHYMNEIYNRSRYNQSYDLLETHSQGQEMLYLYFVENYVTPKAFELIETYELLNFLATIVSSLQVDCFEQAIYLNSYDGTNADKIMADGKITADEYDLLYASISEDFGIMEEFRNDTYWRYGMTITSPCYYVSYSVSAINALQLYTLIHDESFEAAKESYLKLFTYTDTNPYLDTEGVLLNAGLLSYNDEKLYVKLSNFMRKI